MAGSEVQVIFWTIVGIILLAFLIIKTRFHTFLALISCSIIIGLMGGMKQDILMDAIIRGFGNTMGNIGIIIGFGMMMGELFEYCGAAKRMAISFLRLFGIKREEEALAFTGFLISIPIYCDSGYLIVSPMVKALSKHSKKSIVGLAVSLASGLVITHSLVPPTPGPVGVAGIYGADMGSVIIWGTIIAIPMAVSALIYAKHIGKVICQLPSDDGEGWIRVDDRKAIEDKVDLVNVEEIIKELDEKNLPSTTRAFLPVLVPTFLILIGTAAQLYGVEGRLKEFTGFFGSPIIAMGIGLFISIIIGTRGMSREKVVGILEKGIQSAGAITLVIGASGALGSVLEVSNIGEYIGGFIARTKLPAILLPFLIALIMRLIQGSGTVAMLTAASITSPVIAVLGIDPVFATLSACIGSLFFSYFNDPFFWVVTNTIGLNKPKEQLMAWSVTTSIICFVGICSLLVINLLVN